MSSTLKAAESRQNTLILSFFHETGAKKYQCKLCDPNHPGIKGTFYNLKEHLIAKHKETAKGIGTGEKTARKRRLEDPGGINKTVTLQINFNSLRRGLVLFVVGKCISFPSLDDVGF